MGNGMAPTVIPTLPRDAIGTEIYSRDLLTKQVPSGILCVPQTKGLTMGTLNELMDEVEDCKVKIEKLANSLKKVLVLAKVENPHDEEIIKEALALVGPRKIRIYDIEFDFDDEDGTPEVPDVLETEVPAYLADSEVAELASDYISVKTGWCHRTFMWSYV